MNVSFYCAILPQSLPGGQPHCAEILPSGLTIKALGDSFMDILLRQALLDASDFLSLFLSNYSLTCYYLE